MHLNNFALELRQVIFLVHFLKKEKEVGVVEVADFSLWCVARCISLHLVLGDVTNRFDLTPCRERYVSFVLSLTEVIG